MRKNILKIYGYTLAILLIYWLWGELTGLYIPCIYRLTTGYLCPGCGISRMFLALARLDIAGAFAHNPVCFVLLIVWNLVAILLFTEKVKFVQKPRFLYGMLILTVAVLLIFTLVRNIP